MSEKTTNTYICDGCELMCEFGTMVIKTSNKENNQLSSNHTTYYMPKINNHVISALSHEIIKPLTSEQQAINKAREIAKHNCLLYNQKSK